jgi:hypothetical protein
VVQVFHFLLAPALPGDDWLSEIDVPEQHGGADADDLITQGRASPLSRFGSRRIRLIQVTAVGMIGAALLASFLVGAAGKHIASSAPPSAVVGLPFRFALIPTMASECTKNACTSYAATDKDLASLREFFGPTYLVRGDRIRDRRGVLRGVSASIRDGRGDDVQLRAIWSPSAPAHWTGTAGFDGGILATRTLLQTRHQGVWLVESRAVSPRCDGVTAPLWGLAEIGADAAQLHL